MRPLHELKLNEDECELSLYVNGFHAFSFKLDELQTSTDILAAIWHFSSEHPHSPALVGAALRSLRTLLVGRNADDKMSTRYGFKPAPLDRWKGTRVIPAAVAAEAASQSNQSS